MKAPTPDRKVLEARVEEYLRGLFGTDPIEGLEKVYTSTPKDLEMTREDFHLAAYAYTKIHIEWILEALKFYEEAT